MTTQDTNNNHPQCHRCGAVPAIPQTFCAECDPVPLCGACTTQHVMEIEMEPGYDLAHTQEQRK